MNETKEISPRPRFRVSLFGVWAGALLLLVGESFLPQFARRLIADGFLDLFRFLLWATVVAIFLYWFAIFVRFLLRKIFWRVGMRLALSYFLIGVLPFVFFAVFILVIGYVAAGVLSQTAFRVERQSSLSRLDQWNLEHALTGGRPSSGLESLEIYDTADGTVGKLPDWLQHKAFNGMVHRDGQILLVSSKIFNKDRALRSVVLVQPVDASYGRNVEAKNGMSIRSVVARTDRSSPRSRRKRGITLGRDARPGEVNIQLEEEVNKTARKDGELELDEFIHIAWKKGGVIWGDMSPPLTEWDTGVMNPRLAAVTILSNPWRNLNTFYFGNWRYSQIVLATIGSLAGTLAVIYVLALMLAAGLIFSISRAVNRIEKGTVAVEQGDFSYRIGLRARNQLGQVAQSFDRMTQSVSALLGKVAEQERLQSEVDIAASIQRNLLPKEAPHGRGLVFAAHFEPTASIGGDYYDVFTLDHDRIAVAIGDVSGHGLSTGIVMAMVKAAMSTLIDVGADEVSLFKRLNDLVYKSTEKRAFMTLAFTIFDLRRRTIRHTNAGHLFPYLLRDGAPPRAIEAPSLPLGVRSTIEPTTIELDLRERDTMVYLSDGIIEAQDRAGDPFGFDQLEAILASMSRSAPSDIQDEILRRILKHSAGRPADDDRTVMILRLDSVGRGEGDLAPHVNELMVS